MLDREPVPKMSCNYHLRKFHSWEQYLYPANEELLVVIYSLCYRKKKTKIVYIQDLY